MAGGTFTARNKVRPGAYINFTAQPRPLGTVGERGTALLPLRLDYGPTGVMIPVRYDTDVRPLFGVDSGDASLLLLRECAKRAQTVLVWRLGEAGEKASCTDSGLTVTALYGGEGGNAITVKIIEEEEAFLVETWLGISLMDSQRVGAIDDLTDNALVTFSGTGPLTAHAGLVLAGGTTPEGSNADYDGFLTAAALADFETMALPTTESEVQQKVIQFVRRMREDEGKKIQAVLPQCNADYEGIISVRNGVILEDGTVIDKAAATAYLAGMTAGAQVNQSCTYDRYDGAVDVDERLLDSEIIDALKAGHMVLTPRTDRVIIEQDQNSLVSFTPEKTRVFAKNRTLRVLDQLARDIQDIFERYYLGKATNNADGRRLYQGELLSYLRQLAEMSAIEEPENTDVTVSPGEDADTVVVEMLVQPVDSMEKLYLTVTVA